MSSSDYLAWGIYDKSGNPIFNSTTLTLISSSARLSTASVEYHKEARVCDFPVEQGSFASYNKVEMPSLPIVVLCLSGSANDRTTFLNKLDSAAISTDLYSVVTPEVTYIDHTIERFNYSRKNDKGATLLTVEIFLKQIRQILAPTSSTQSVSGATATNTGNVSGDTPSPPSIQTADKIIKNWH